MIVLDTNVISEMARPFPSPAVAAWLDAQVPSLLFITSVTIAELGFGIAVLAEGRRKQALLAALGRTEAAFEGRTLPFDFKAAHAYATIAASARAEGSGFPLPDGYIAAIAAANGFSVATRDTGPFLAGGLSVINPWAIG